MTTTWADFATAEPDLAAAVARRFAANLHHVLGTVAPDGSPRLSGLEVPIRDGHLWLGMMPGSRKRADLDRDPRFAVHSAPLEEDLAEGDAKVDGVAVPVAPEDSLTVLFLSGMDIDPAAHEEGGMSLWWADVRRVTLTQVADDVLRVRMWTPEDGLIEQVVR